MLSLQVYVTETDLQSSRPHDSESLGCQDHDYHITAGIIEASVTFGCRSICNLFIAPDTLQVTVTARFKGSGFGAQT